MLVIETDKNHKSLPRIPPSMRPDYGQMKRRGKKRIMGPQLDLMTLYAYADRSHAGERESWREFLSYLVPVLFQMDGAEIAQLLDEAMTDSTDELSSNFESSSPKDIMREISGEIAEALNLQREFGLAAFLEGEHHPSRVYPLKKKKSKKENEETSRWMMDFSRIQTDPDFEGRLAELKNRLEIALHEGIEELPQTA